MSYSALSFNTKQVDVSIIDPAAGTTTLDPVTREPIYSLGVLFTIKANFTHLSSSEKVARSQLQDDSQFKIIIEDTESNRTITNKFQASINNVIYNITGEPKKPVLPIGWMTVYLKEK